MFNPYGLLESEREAGRLLGSCILSLRSQADKFATALDLADFCDQERAPSREVMRSRSVTLGRTHTAAAINSRFIGFKIIATDAGAIALYNFKEIIDAISGLIGMVPTAKDNMDGKLMKEGRQVFDRAFPDYVGVRFSVAHAGKRFASPERFKGHLPPGTNAAIIGMLSDRTFFTMANGKEAAYSLVRESADALKLSAELIDQAFAPVRALTSPYSSAEQRETPEQPPQDQDRPPQK